MNEEFKRSNVGDDDFPSSEDFQANNDNDEEYLSSCDFQDTDEDFQGTKQDGENFN